MITQNIFNLSNIKFLLNIQVNTPDTKHIKQILVILFKSHKRSDQKYKRKIPSFFNYINNYFPVFESLFLSKDEYPRTKSQL